MKLKDFLNIRVIVVVNEFNYKGEYGPVSYVGNVIKIDGNNILLSNTCNFTGGKWKKLTESIVINAGAASFVSINEIKS